LRAADVVVINKCDLASLAGLSGVEDLVQRMAPGVRTLRARFGQVCEDIKGRDAGVVSGKVQVKGAS
jgi:G3E family GTPase